MRVVEQALRGPKSEQPELWEADIRMHPQKKIPVMAHDPEHALTSNLTFKEFLNLAYRHNKGIKLDFKDPKAVAPCLKILNQFVSAKNIEQLENFEFSAVPFADGDLGLLSAGDKADDQKHGGNGGSKQNEEEKEMRVMYKADSERTKTSLFQKENDMEVDERNEEKQSQDILLTYTDHGSNKENIALKQEGQIKKGPKREKDESLKNSDNNTSQKKHRKKNKKKKCGASLLNEPPSTPSSSLSTTTTMANKSPSSPTSLTTHKRSHLKENRPTRSPVYTPPRTPPTASPLVFPLVFINADLVMGPGGGEVCFDPKTFIQLTRECNESANPSTGSPSSSTSPPPSCLSPSSLTLSSRMDTSYVLSIGATTGACFMRNLDGYTEQHIDDLLDLVKHFPLQKGKRRAAAFYARKSIAAMCLFYSIVCTVWWVKWSCIYLSVRACIRSFNHVSHTLTLFVPFYLSVTWALRAQYLVWAWRQRPSKCQELIDNPNHTITLWGSQALKKRGAYA